MLEVINFNLIETKTYIDGITGFYKLKLHNNTDSGKIYKTMIKKSEILKSHPPPTYL